VPWPRSWSSCAGPSTWCSDTLLRAVRSVRECFAADVHGCPRRGVVGGASESSGECGGGGLPRSRGRLPQVGVRTHPPEWRPDVRQDPVSLHRPRGSEVHPRPRPRIGGSRSTALAPPPSQHERPRRGNNVTLAGAGRRLLSRDLKSRRPVRAPCRRRRTIRRRGTSDPTPPARKPEETLGSRRWHRWRRQPVMAPPPADLPSIRPAAQRPCSRDICTRAGPCTDTAGGTPRRSRTDAARRGPPRW
jgi:hypothetical protein